MLDTYKEKQPIAYNILVNAIKLERLSHAYLFNANGCDDVFDIVLSFAVEIICHYNKLNDKKNIIQKIKNGNDLDVKIIEPDGLWIKKEQLVDLQHEFSKKSLEKKKKIYIIKSIEKMNVQSANSILKFLEEPVDEIIAILITNNINLVLPTIISRCQILELQKNISGIADKKDFSLLFNEYKICLDESNKKKFIDDVGNFIVYLEQNGLDVLLYVKKLWHNVFKDRESNLLAIEIMINIYFNALKVKAGLNTINFSDMEDKIRTINDNNSIEKIIKKLECLDDAEYGLKRNLNINLLIDKLILNMCGDILW